MLDLPPNTLAMALANPMFDRIDMGDVPVSNLAKEMALLSGMKKPPVPETEALTFYFLNHAFHVMRKKYHPLETLSPEMNRVAETYTTRSTEVSRRLFSFLMVITSYMAQYMGSQKDSFYTHIEQKCGEGFCKWMRHDFAGKGWGSYSSTGGNNPFLTKLSSSLNQQHFTCSEFAQGLVSMFMYADWGQNRGLGKWDLITLCATNLLRGEVSLEQMADQAFSLCHQNGTIFEKGYLYQRNTNQIYHLLDVQHSGQIPQWVSQNRNHSFVTDEIREIFDILAQAFPGDMKGKVDQNLVQESKEKREKVAQAFHTQLRQGWNNGFARQQAKAAAPAPSQKMDDIIFGIARLGI